MDLFSIAGVFLDSNFPVLPVVEVDRLVDAVIAVTSSSMFLELRDRMGWDVDEAARASLWMVEALIDKAEAP